MITSLKRFVPAVLTLLALTASVEASMRCKGGIVQTGDLMVEVERKCGEPSQRQQIGPAVRPDGMVVQGAVTVEDWVYGPTHGMYYYLHFVEGRLTRIDSKRDL